MHKTKRADVLFIHFDMAGLDVSMGSACSSGSVEQSHVLRAMGHIEMSKNSIRLSLGNDSIKEDLYERLSSVIGKL
jgi:cysteine desulfurase